MITEIDEAITEAAMQIHYNYTTKDSPELMKGCREVIARCLTPAIAILENDLRQVRNNLVLSKDRDARSRTGWKFASEAVAANQRYIAILESELATLRSGK